MRCFVAGAVARGLCELFALLVSGMCLPAVAAGTNVLAPPSLLTNLLQLRNAAEQAPLTVHPLHIAADVIDADAAGGVLVLRDASGVEFIQADFTNRDIAPGATVCLESRGCAVEQKGFGLSVVPAMAVDNDGVHALAAASGKVFLHAGRNPIAVQWFNQIGDWGLKVEYEGPNTPRRSVPSSVLSRTSIDRATGQAHFSAGLDYRCYEGDWDFLPDFAKCQPAQIGISTNFDLNVRTRDTNVGLEFKGFIAVPADGLYTFYLTSDDGSRLFLGDSSLDVRVLSWQPAPTAARDIPSTLPERDSRPWVTLEGTVTYAGVWTYGGELQMRVGNQHIHAEVLESGDFTPVIAPQSKVRVTGIYEDVVSEDGARVPGRLLVMNWKAVQPVATSNSPPAETVSDGEANRLPAAGGVRTAPAASPISTVAEIKALSGDEAKQALPVSIRGVVTAYVSKTLGAVVQDSTGGVYVDMENLLETEPLHRGELCQIDGVTGPGWFAPDVVARRIRHLGPGQLPKPLHATWGQLVNGSLDTEYAELDGVVTAIHDHQVVLLMQGGKVTLDLTDFRPETLLGYQNALVRIRGCVFASFNMGTHQLRPGWLTVRSAAIDVLQPAPEDPFAAPRKTIGELLFYDPKAAPFRLLKVSGQIIYGQPGDYFLTDGTNGMRVAARNAEPFSVGDLVDAAGFLDLGGPAVELKEATMRRIGHAPLRPAAKLAPDQLLQAPCADMRVQVDATLVDQWREGSQCVLQLQSGFLAFQAWINSRGRPINLPPSGSRLELTGVYVPQGSRAADGTVSGFELLLPSPADIRILATPPWWTLKRVLVLAGVLAALLFAVLLWNKELHLKVQERGRQLEAEIRNRQQAELKHAAEAERARIARDLHDELGAGLTEVSLLANTGLGDSGEVEKKNDLFRIIAEKARALVSGLDVIVWAIDPRRNSLQSFTDYLGRYATEVFSASGVVCRFKIPIECEAVSLAEGARHSLFLAVKEALNNVIRHAAATEVKLEIIQNDDRLEIVIADNGRGFDWSTIRRGNGVTNLHERVKALNGQCHIEAQPGKGTTVTFTVPLPCRPD